MQSQEQKNIDLFSATLIARNSSEDQNHEWYSLSPESKELSEKIAMFTNVVS